jgi:hypothetical protein
LKKPSYIGDDAKALLERRVAELEEANSRMKPELERSKQALVELQSSYDEKNAFCEHASLALKFWMKNSRRQKKMLS